MKEEIKFKTLKNIFKKNEFSSDLHTILTEFNNLNLK